MLRKANQKRSLDDLVIQKGEFDWRSLFRGTGVDTITHALEDFADHEDARAARMAAREAGELEGADAADFEEDAGAVGRERLAAAATPAPASASVEVDAAAVGSPSGPLEDGEPEEEPVEEEVQVTEEGAGDEDEGGTTVDYMLAFVRFDYEFFRDWRL